MGTAGTPRGERNLTGRQRQALEIIRSTAHGTTTAWLGDQLGCNKYSAAVTAASLVGRGLATRHQNPHQQTIYLPTEPRP